MAAKRLGFDSPNELDQPKEKRMRRTPSFASVIEEVMMVRSFNGLCNALEPLLRKVVNEEVERGIQKTIRTVTRSPSFRIQAPEPTTLKLVFVNKSLPTTFTCNKVVDINGEPIQLLLVEQKGDQMTPTTLDRPIKVEIVVVDGDFPPQDRELWTAEEFNGKVVKEREGRRPLLGKDVNYVIREKGYVNVGDIELTDNSSWIRCRRFRLGARVVDGGSSLGVRILEALTEPFVVKDQRGELYKKHYPPMLGDEVWRLEKIGKDGKFHKRLSHERLNTVQDLLKLLVIDQTRLKKILGGKNGISERIWDAILKHAKTCDLGNKLYICRGTDYTIILDPICQVASINFNGQTYSTSDMNIAVKKNIEQLVKNASENWDSLQEVDRAVDDIYQVSEVNMMAECSSSLAYGIEIGENIELDGSQQDASNALQIEFGNSEASYQLI